MPSIAEVIDCDKLFRGLKQPVIFINDIPNNTEADKERIRALTITRLNSDTISIVPSCACGATRGRYALGKKCPVPTCGDTVRSNIDDSIQSLLWFRAPEGVKALINPVILEMLNTYFSKSNYSAIQYLTDNLYSPNVRTPPEIEKLAGRGFKRDLNYFIDNFDAIIEALMEIFKPTASKPYGPLRMFLTDHRHLVFPQQIPLLNKSMFIADKTNVGIYMENTIRTVLDAIYHVVSIDKDFYDRSPAVVVNRTARTLVRISTFCNEYIVKNFQPKPGHMRRQMHGSRCIFSARAVVSSTTGDHKYDEVGIPWRIAMVVYQHHLMGMLMRHGYNYNGAYGYWLRHVNVYDKRLDKFLTQIFDEAPGGRGPAVIVHRNPTLQQGSMLRMFGYLNRDTSNMTMLIPILSVVSMNCD